MTYDKSKIIGPPKDERTSASFSDFKTVGINFLSLVYRLVSGEEFSKAIFHLYRTAATERGVQGHLQDVITDINKKILKDIGFKNIAAAYQLRRQWKRGQYWRIGIEIDPQLINLPPTGALAATEGDVTSVMLPRATEGGGRIAGSTGG